MKRNFLFLFIQIFLMSSCFAETKEGKKEFEEQKISTRTLYPEPSGRMIIIGMTGALGLAAGVGYSNGTMYQNGWAGAPAVTALLAVPFFEWVLLPRQYKCSTKHRLLREELDKIKDPMERYRAKKKQPESWQCTIIRGSLVLGLLSAMVYPMVTATTSNPEERNRGQIGSFIIGGSLFTIIATMIMEERLFLPHRALGRYKKRRSSFYLLPEDSGFKLAYSVRF